MEPLEKQTQDALEKNEVVQEELKRTEKEEVPQAPEKRSNLAWLAGSIVFILGLAAFYSFLKSHQALFPAPERLLRFASGAIICFSIIVASQVIKIFLVQRLASKVSRYNLRRIINFLRLIALAFVCVTIVFANWYAAIVSLGLISLILSFSLQTPITSFIGWIYILIRTPFRVGDRIKIGDAAGDVIDVSYLDTTLWEFGGEYLSTDHPSGRIIKFPNSLVLSQPVYNYSWPLFPYIWNEIKFNIAYESDLNFVAAAIQEIAEEEIGREMMERVKVFKSLLSRTPVDQLQVQEKPVVLFRSNPNTWIDVIVRYLVHPKESGRIKTRLTMRILERMKQSADRVLFPKSNLR